MQVIGPGMIFQTKKTTAITESIQRPSKTCDVQLKLIYTHSQNGSL